MPTKLGIWNDALRMIGEHRLVSLTEDTEARYVLDSAWDDAKMFVFTEGLWNFATKTEEINADTGQTPIPGFAFVFDKPLYWLRTISISQTSRFDTEAIYRDENNKIHANVDTLYIRFISYERSTDEQIENWPPSFAKAMSAYLANTCAVRISGSKSDADALRALYRDALASAKNKDALDQAQMFTAPGNWIRAMRGSSSRWDRGSLSGY
jgi:hypothetical protein